MNKDPLPPLILALVLMRLEICKREGIISEGQNAHRPIK